MATTLEEARGIVRSSLLHSVNNTSPEGGYGPVTMDRAIRFAGNDFAERTRAIRGTTDVSLSSGSHIVNFRSTSGMERFIEQNLIWASISGKAVKLAPLHTIQRKYDGATPTGQPTMIAFEGPTRAWLYPEPASAYTLTVFWWQPFTSFTLGTTSAVTLNIPDQYADGVFGFGAAIKMCYADPAVLYGQIGWREYVNFRDAIAAQYRPELDYPKTTDPDAHKEAAAHAA